MRHIIFPFDAVLFIEYLKFWHGDHDNDCGISAELKKWGDGDSTIEKLKEAFEEVDADYDSLEQYILDMTSE